MSDALGIRLGADYSQKGGGEAGGTLRAGISIG